MREIIPAVMPQSLEDLHAELAFVKDYCDRVQIDIMDGNFVKGKTWPYIHNFDTFEALISEAEGLPYWQDVDFEIDLMVTKPEEEVEKWIAAGASRIVVHIESTKNMDAIVALFRQRFAPDPETHKRDIELGIALSISTPTEAILPYLEDVDFVQFMGIEPIGFQGQPFDERVIDKIREFHNAHPQITISVDGGVNLESAPVLLEAGVERLVAGSAIFESENVKFAIEQFKQLF